MCIRDRLTYDMYLNVDNSSEPFNIPCDDGGGIVDVWCPQGAASEDISFFRSDAEVADSVRSPVNYATAHIDLDFVYGRSEEEAKALRTLEGGLMNVTGNGVPFRHADGTWLVSRCVFWCCGVGTIESGTVEHLGRRFLMNVTGSGVPFRTADGY